MLAFIILSYLYFASCMQLHAEHRKNKNDFGTRDNNSSAYMQILRAGAVAELLYCLLACHVRKYFFLFFLVGRVAATVVIHTHIYYCAAGKRTEKKTFLSSFSQPANPKGVGGTMFTQSLGSRRARGRRKYYLCSKLMSRVCVYLCFHIYNCTHT